MNYKPEVYKHMLLYRNPDKECWRKIMDVVNDNYSSVENTENHQVVSITQAAKLNNVTRQAIYVAVKQNKLKAIKTTRWEISLEDLESYKKNKYSRKKSTFDGELIFDNNKGLFSINEVASILNVPAQKIYYATRTGTIQGIRKGAAWVISEDEIQRYKSEYLDQNKKPDASIEI